MRQHVQICDVCGKIVKQDDKMHAPMFSLFEERVSDGAGSRENNYFTFDLCSDHLYVLAKALLAEKGQHTSEAAKFVKKWLKGFKK